jgi:pimeloyl-ACP methyl ester carboxylesterase
MLAVIAEPGRFRALVMLDPTLRPPYQLKILEALKALRLMHRFPLAQGARRRRSRFASTEEAYVYWRQRRLFADWSDEVLHHYAESMTQPAPDGDGVLLRWHPEWEARYYENIITDVWSDVPKRRGLLPTLVVRGAETDTFVEGACRKFARMVPDALMIDLPGQGHLFPQAAPDQTRAVIEDWLRTLPS